MILSSFFSPSFFEVWSTNKNYIYLGCTMWFFLSCTMWRFNICMHCEMIATIRFFLTHPSTHIVTIFFGVCVLRTLMIYCLSKFQIFSIENRIEQLRKSSSFGKKWKFVERSWRPVGFFFLPYNFLLVFISYRKPFRIPARLPSFPLKPLKAPCWSISQRKVIT